MEEHPLELSAPKRAWEDSKKWLFNNVFPWVLAFALPGVGTMLATWLIPLDSPLTLSALYGSLGGLAGLLLLFGGTYAWNLFRAPYRQRDEARKALAAIPGIAKSSPLTPEPELVVQTFDWCFATSDTEGYPKTPTNTLWLRVYPHFQPKLRTVIERVELALSGEKIPADDWTSVQVDIPRTTGYLYFAISEKIPSGEHKVAILAFADGRWWSSLPDTIIVPQRPNLDKEATLN